MIFELSKRARADVKNIAHYTLANFGLAQTGFSSSTSGIPAKIRSE
jgi:hypothetical protein